VRAPCFFAWRLLFLVHRDVVDSATGQGEAWLKHWSPVKVLD
jgi:hypothetical protein